MSDNEGIKIMERELYQNDDVYYDDHVDACAHLSKLSWDRFGYLPTLLAIDKGETLDAILYFIWHDSNNKQPTKRAIDRLSRKIFKLDVV